MKTCRACEINANDEQVKQMPMHTCGKDGSIELARSKSTTNPSHGYSEGAEVPEDKTTSDNELIAEFMGRVFWWNKDFLEYDKSWDWLMPVWMKFRDLDFPRGSEDFNKHGDWIYSLQWYLFSSDEPKRFAERLAYAIKWYNKTRTRIT